jgi:hypothetical protein
LVHTEGVKKCSLRDGDLLDPTMHFLEKMRRCGQEREKDTRNLFFRPRQPRLGRVGGGKSSKLYETETISETEKELPKGRGRRQKRG